MTNQRLAIFDAAYGYEDHFTAEELLDRAREIDNSVSRATVYRAPVRPETVREVDVERDYKFYMANRNTRTFPAQVIYLDCDKISRSTRRLWVVWPNRGLQVGAGGGGPALAGHRAVSAGIRACEAALGTARRPND